MRGEKDGAAFRGCLHDGRKHILRRSGVKPLTRFVQNQKIRLARKCQDQREFRTHSLGEGLELLVKGQFECGKQTSLNLPAPSRKQRSGKVEDLFACHERIKTLVFAHVSYPPA